MIRLSKNHQSADLIILRLINSHVLSPLSTHEEVALALMGIQSQIHNASSIAYSIRIDNKTHQHYIDALKTMRLLKIWGIRTTLHTYAIEDHPLIQARVMSYDNWFQKKMKKRGVDINQLIEKADSIISKEVYFDRELLIQNGISQEYVGPWGDLLIELNNRGIIAHAISDNSKTKQFVNLKKIQGMDFEQLSWDSSFVKAIFARRFFYAYGPATKYDFAHWLDCSIKEAEYCISLIDEELTYVFFCDKCYLYPKERMSLLDEEIKQFAANKSCILLPKFDPLLLAFEDKSWLIPDCHQKEVWKVAGQVEGVILSEWKAIGTWKYKIKIQKLDFTITMFSDNYELSQELLFQSCEKIANYFCRRLGNITIRGKNESIIINN